VCTKGDKDDLIDTTRRDVLASKGEFKEFGGHVPSRRDYPKRVDSETPKASRDGGNRLLHFLDRPLQHSFSLGRIGR